MDHVGHQLQRARLPPPRGDPAWRLHVALATPVFRAYRWLGFAAPAVHLQSLLVTLTGLGRMSTGDWPALVAGSLVVYLGHVLAHAGRLLADDKGHTAWSRFLDAAVARVVEIAMLVTLAWAEARGVGGVPGILPPAWQPLGIPAFLAVCGAAVASLLLWRYAQAVADLLLLRTHLAMNRRVPGPTAMGAPVRMAPASLNRDWLFAALLLGVLLHQLQALVMAILAAHAIAVLVAVGSFRRRLHDPEDAAVRILERGYRL